MRYEMNQPEMLTSAPWYAKMNKAPKMVTLFFKASLRFFSFDAAFSAEVCLLVVVSKRVSSESSVYDQKDHAANAIQQIRSPTVRK
jgi:hypothetical protein